MRTQNTLANTTATAGARATEGDMALHAMRTGENTAGYAPAAAEARRNSSRDLTTFLAQANQNRLSALTDVQKTALDASKYPSQVYSSLYGTGVQGSSGQIDAAANAAKTPGFWDTFAPALAQGAGTAAAGFCPCKGSMILMADGLEKPVEEIKEGEYVWSLSTSAPPNPVRRTPQPILQPAWKIRTANGHEHSGSESHTIALAIGGYATMPEAKWQIALVELATDEVVSSESIGEREVYPMELGGNHTYRADGIWIIS